MARNGSGTMALVAGNPVVTNTAITSAVQNNTMADVANEITNSLARDGQSPATANIPFGGYKATGLGAATVAGDGVRYEQVGTLNIAEVHAATSKATPVDADELPLADSAASFGLKKLTWANLKATFLATVNTWTGAQTFTSTVDLSGAVLQGATPIVFEGATADAFETSFAITDPTADRTVTFKDASGTVAFTSDITTPTIASTAEAQAQTNNTNFLTPLRLKEALQSGNQSLASSGYQKLPGGLILQWGLSGSIGSGATVAQTYPLTWPSGAFSFATVPGVAGSTHYVNPVSASQFNIANTSGSASTFYWIAIGN